MMYLGDENEKAILDAVAHGGKPRDCVRKQVPHFKSPAQDRAASLLIAVKSIYF